VGHGGKDIGNTSSSFAEKDVVLSIAKKIKAMNENEDLEIILTRDTDAPMSLQERIDLINSRDADLMISLHLNAHGQSSKNGIELFTGRSNNESSVRSARLAKELKKSLAADFQVSELKKANFKILRDSQCPAILIEMGFLTNPKDREFLTSEEGQEQMARTILEALE